MLWKICHVVLKLNFVSFWWEKNNYYMRWNTLSFKNIYYTEVINVWQNLNFLTKNLNTYKCIKKTFQCSSRNTKLTFYTFC